MKRVFLGGTCGDMTSPNYNRWREDKVIPALQDAGFGEACYFNPVVKNWTKEDQVIEDAIKRDPETIMLYVITNPRTPGNEVSAYSLVEATMALYDDPERTVVTFDFPAFSVPVAKAIAKAAADLRQRFLHAYIDGNIDAAISRVIMLLS